MTNFSTENIIKQCKTGDEESWEWVFRAFYPLAEWVTKHNLFNTDNQIIEDIAQSAMVALVKNIDRIKDENHLKRFICKTAKNKCIDYLRVNKQITVEVSDYLPAETEEKIDFDSALDKIKAMIESLGNPCTEIIRNRYLKEKSYQEIANIIGLPLNQIGVHLSRCLTYLKNELERKKITWDDLL